jgi:hypothetical protein
MRMNRRAGTRKMVMARWVETLERHREDGANVIGRRMRSVARGPSSPHLLDQPAAGAPKSRNLSRTELAAQTAVAEMAARQVTDRRRRRVSRKGFGGWVGRAVFPFLLSADLRDALPSMAITSADTPVMLATQATKRRWNVVASSVAKMSPSRVCDWGSVLERREPRRKIDPSPASSCDADEVLRSRQHCQQAQQAEPLEADR